MKEEQEEFIALAIAYLEDRLTESDKTTFLEELKRDAGKKKQFFALKDIYDVSDNTAIPDANMAWKDLQGKLEPVTLSNRAEYSGQQYLTFVLRAAAVLLMIVGAWYLVRLNVPIEQKTDIVFRVSTAASGTQQHVRLPDGTEVRLNASSTLLYPETFEGDERKVVLSGEAFFKVAKDAEHPFIVSTDKINIKVLGTVFNVSAYASAASIETTLIEGSVGVSPNEAGSDRVIIKPSQQLKYFREENRMLLSEVDTALYTSWMNGYFQFKDTPLEDVLQRLSTWYGVQITYTQPSLKGLRFTGSLPMRKAVQYNMKLIGLTSSVKLKLEHDRIIVSP